LGSNLECQSGSLFWVKSGNSVWVPFFGEIRKVSLSPFFGSNPESQSGSLFWVKSGNSVWVPFLGEIRKVSLSPFFWVKSGKSVLVPYLGQIRKLSLGPFLGSNPFADLRLQIRIRRASRNPGQTMTLLKIVSPVVPKVDTRQSHLLMPWAYGKRGPWTPSSFTRHALPFYSKPCRRATP
jgi:hypothetical protein